MTKTTAAPAERRGLPSEREIELPPQDYQPTKAEREREYDMPGAPMEKVHSAFFRRSR